MIVRIILALGWCASVFGLLCFGAVVAVFTSDAGTTRRVKPRELVCPSPAALRSLDADGCPPGRWGFPDTMLEGRRVAGRVQVCAEIVRLCAAR